MRIIKCDICKKTIKDNQEIVHVGVGYVNFEICFDCGKSTIKLMKDSGIIDENNKRIKE